MLESDLLVRVYSECDDLEQKLAAAEAKLADGGAAE